MPLSTKDAIDPAVLVSCQAHVVDVGGRDDVLGHGDGIVPEAEVVDAVRALSHSKERLAVGSLHTDNKQVLAAPLDGAAVERRIHADALQQQGIGALIQVVAPKDGRVRSRQDGMFVSGDDAVAPFDGLVGAANQRLVRRKQLSHPFVKRFHDTII